ncbi:MAG: LytTR family DNA-binding domain-containing protein [Bacteroidales bacterium]|nr:LytTR family DNA-binding domain-containing protein [Bacteroidales bacterium]
MITCIVIDDEPLALKQLGSYVKKTPFLELLGSFYSAKDSAEFLSQNTVDVIFTDINMPDINGMDFVKSLSKPPLVVFSTAYEEYAVESFKVDAIDYLLKPYGYDEFLRASTKVRQYVEWKQAASKAETSSTSPEGYIFVRADNKSVKVLFDSILYVEAMSEYIRIHFKDGTSIMTFMSVKLMAESLPSNSFMRVHRSYIIALDSINNMRRNEVELVNGRVIPVSASYKDELISHIENHSLLRH